MWLLDFAAAGRGPTLAAGIVALSFCAAVEQARAEDHIVIEKGFVKMRDLDLTTAHGAKVLLRRVEARASDLCAPTPSPLERGADKAWRDCVAKAVGRSIASLKAPLVMAEYARVFGPPQSIVSSR
jgi:UrcA family protein